MLGTSVALFSCPPGAERAGTAGIEKTENPSSVIAKEGLVLRDGGFAAIEDDGQATDCPIPCM
jgi:hypothetical protein